MIGKVFSKKAIFVLNFKKTRQEMIKIGYGISNYESMVTEGRYYVDRTNYIDVLENVVQIGRAHV